REGVGGFQRGLCSSTYPIASRQDMFIYERRRKEGVPMIGRAGLRRLSFGDMHAVVYIVLDRRVKDPWKPFKDLVSRGSIRTLGLEAGTYLEVPEATTFARGTSHVSHQARGGARLYGSRSHTCKPHGRRYQCIPATACPRTRAAGPSRRRSR